MAADAAAYALMLRKNPFSRVAHAAALGKEVLELTVRTTGFERLLEIVARSEAQGEPLAMVALGPAGSGKTHFLKFMEHTYKPLTEAWRDDEELSAEPQFHRVVFVPNPGSSFADLVRRVIRDTLDPETLGRLVDRLLAFPARALCLAKVQKGEEPDANERLAFLLRKKPKEIENYWSRFSKSEIYNAALSALDQISRHPVFRDSLAELLRARRDGVVVDYEDVVHKLVEQWSGLDGNAAGQATSKRDFEAVQIAESVLALLDLLEVRLLLMIDECQVVLRGENSVSENVLFRQLVNATPRGSVMAFALRTEDWLRFADEASERRVRFQKFTVSPEECWEIILLYVIKKGGNPHLTMENAGELFPEEAARCLWSEAGGVVGRTLALCYEVYERLTAGPGSGSVTDIAREVAGEARGSVIARPSAREVASSVDDIVRNTSALLNRKVRKGEHGFDFEVLDQINTQPAIVVSLLQADNDVEEAGHAHYLGKAILDLHEASPRTLILVVISGYRSPEVTDIVSFLADRVVALDESQWNSRAMLAEALRELIVGADNTPQKPHTPQEDLQWVDELAAVKRRRRTENARFSRSESREEPTFQPQWLPWSVGSTKSIVLAVLILSGVSLFVLQYQQQQKRSDEVASRYQAAMSDFLAGPPAKTELALGEIDRILSHSPQYLETTRSALVAYLKFGDQQPAQIRQEVLTFLRRLQKNGWRPSDLHGAQLGWLDLHGIDLSGCNLTDANLISADLRQAKLLNANLRGAQMIGANLLGADLQGANLQGANLRGVLPGSLRGACGDERTTLPEGTDPLRACSRNDGGL